MEDLDLLLRSATGSINPAWPIFLVTSVILAQLVRFFQFAWNPSLGFPQAGYINCSKELRQAPSLLSRVTPVDPRLSWRIDLLFDVDMGLLFDFLLKIAALVHSFFELLLKRPCFSL